MIVVAKRATCDELPAFWKRFDTSQNLEDGQNIGEMIDY